MSGAANCPETPRQKMIGMMYLVLTAMLALNVSADILNGFSMVGNSLLNNIETSEVRNAALHDDMNYLYQQNPQKVSEWLEKSKVAKEKSDDLFNILSDYKIGIVQLADGEEADPTGNTLIKKDNLDVAGEYVGISTGLAKGNALKQAIIDYKLYVQSVFENDESKKEIFEKMYSTEPSVNSHGETVDWISATFQSMPAIAVTTMLTKYQSDIRATEAEIINHFKAQTDAGDFRVNKIMAKLIPVSKHVMQGGTYQAEVALMAVDSTKAPKYYLGETQLDSCFIKRGCSSVGTFPIKGRIDLVNGEGQVVSYPFEDEYTVGAPTATIANIDMNVVYKGYPNKLEVSVPGVASDKLSVQCVGGSIKKDGTVYICSPNVNNVVKINVFADIEGKKQPMGSGEFRVKTLPDPTAFLKIIDSKGNVVLYLPNSKYKPKRKEVIDGEMVAEYADGLLKASFKITGFQMLVSDGRGGYNASKSNGSKFSPSQRNVLSRIKPGSRILFDKIQVTGAKNTQLSYPPIVLP